MYNLSRVLCAIGASLLVASTPVAATETALDVKHKILQDVKAKEARLMAEKEKLNRLIQEEKALNLDARARERDESNADQIVGTAKAAVEQARDGRINTLRETYEASKRSVDVLNAFKDWQAAETRLWEELDRDGSIGSDLVNQERQVKKAARELGVAQGAAAAVLPLLEAMIETERIQAIRNQRAATHAAGDAAARQQLREAQSRPPARPGMVLSPSGPPQGGLPAPSLPPTRTGTTPQTTITSCN